MLEREGDVAGEAKTGWKGSDDYGGQDFFNQKRGRETIFSEVRYTELYSNNKLNDNLRPLK